MATNVTYTYPKITLIHWDFISDMFKLKLLTKSAKFTLPNPLIRYMAKSSHILEPMLEKLESSKIYCVIFFIKCLTQTHCNWNYRAL